MLNFDGLFSVNLGLRMPQMLIFTSNVFTLLSVCLKFYYML
jgi:hypothetical protein